MTISAKTKVCAVIGDPIEHSLSPIMHNAAFKALGLDYVYLAFRVKKGNLREAVNGIRNLGIVGVNVTTPHKVTVIKFLDSLDPLAEAIGAVNTIHNKNGELIGYNTDGIGALKALKERVSDLKGRKTIILGAGGAARAVAFYLTREGVNLTILNRTESKAVELAETINKKFRVNVAGSKLTEPTLRRALAGADILINTTFVGMHPRTSETLVTRKMMNPRLTVFDIVYNPVKTRLLQEAEAAGAATIDGVNMLVHQGAVSLRIWTGRRAPLEIMRRAVLEELGGVGG